jgi:hypothetical protein
MLRSAGHTHARTHTCTPAAAAYHGTRHTHTCMHTAHTHTHTAHGTRHTHTAHTCTPALDFLLLAGRIEGALLARRVVFRHHQVGAVRYLQYIFVLLCIILLCIILLCIILCIGIRVPVASGTCSTYMHCYMGAVWYL